MPSSADASQAKTNGRDEETKRKQSSIYIQLANNSPVPRRKNTREQIRSSGTPSSLSSASGGERKPPWELTSQIVDVDSALEEAEHDFHPTLEIPRNQSDGTVSPELGPAPHPKREQQQLLSPGNLDKSKSRSLFSVTVKPTLSALTTSSTAVLKRSESLDFEPKFLNSASPNHLTDSSSDWSDVEVSPLKRSLSVAYTPVYEDRQGLRLGSYIRTKNIESFGRQFRQADHGPRGVGKPPLVYHKPKKAHIRELSESLTKANSFKNDLLPLRQALQVGSDYADSSPRSPQSPASPTMMTSRLDLLAKRPSDLGHQPSFSQRWSAITSPKPYKPSPYSSLDGHRTQAVQDHPLSDHFGQTKSSSTDALAQAHIPRSEPWSKSTSGRLQARALAVTPAQEDELGGRRREEGAAALGAEQDGSSGSWLAGKEDSCGGDVGVADPLVTNPGQVVDDVEEEVVQRQPGTEAGNFESVGPESRSKSMKKKRKKVKKEKKSAPDGSVDDIQCLKSSVPEGWESSNGTRSSQSGLWQDFKEKVTRRHASSSSSLVPKRRISYVHAAILDDERQVFPDGKSQWHTIQRNASREAENHSLLELVESLDSESYGHLSAAPSSKPPDLPEPGPEPSLR